MPTLRAALIIAGTVFVAAALAPTDTHAQAGDLISAPNRRMARRSELDSSAVYHERLARSAAYSERTRARAATAAAVARRRLTEGDFQEGDRILLVTGGTVAVDDTLTVLEGRRLAVAGFGPVALNGVLRAELEARLLTDLSALVRNTTVSARPLMRVAVFGAVGAPGFLSVPQESTLDDVISRAGGPVATAAIRKITVTRNERVILDMSDVMGAVAAGRSLSALGIEDGDAVMVPDQGAPWDRTAALQMVTVATSLLLALGIINRR